MYDPKIYNLNQASFRKRILTKSILMFSLNLFFLGISLYWLIQDGKANLGLVSILLGALCLISVILYQNYKRQIELLSKSYVDISGTILRQFGLGGECNTINLKRIKSIKEDKYRGYPRITIEESDESFQFINLEDMEGFKKEISSISGKKIEFIPIEYGIIFGKVVITYIPSIIALILWAFLPIAKITLEIVFLVVNLNSIFLVSNFTEDKVANGFSARSSRRLIIILTLFFAWQVFRVFVK